MKTIIAAAIFALAASTAAAENPVAPKYLRPGAVAICPTGQALSYTMVCDPGSRNSIQEIWNQRPPGVAICRATLLGCGPITGRMPNERPGLAVRDAEDGDEMVGVMFGLEHLLGEAFDQAPPR